MILIVHSHFLNENKTVVPLIKSNTMLSPLLGSPPAPLTHLAGLVVGAEVPGFTPAHRVVGGGAGLHLFLVWGDTNTTLGSQTFEVSLIHNQLSQSPSHLLFSVCLNLFIFSVFLLNLLYFY